MFNWVGGLRPPSPEEQSYDAAMDAPETPAPVFAVRAFKHAIWGTPRFAPEEDDGLLHPTIPSEEDEAKLQQNGSGRSSSSVEERAPSPSKLNGILMTPGTINGRRKQVTFRNSVLDNEGNKSSKQASGLPGNYPGKFPSPWTPKVAHMDEDSLDEAHDSRPRVSDGDRASNAPVIVVQSEDDRRDGQRLPHMAQLMITGQRRSVDDADITIDIANPRSESGRYWKSTYEQYSQRSEEETKVLISKARLARDFAKMKDEEVLELKVALSVEKRRVEKEKRKRHERERSLEEEVKDLREKLRVALGENAKNITELAMLRRKSEEIRASGISQAGSGSGPNGGSKRGRELEIPREPAMEERSFSPSNLLPLNEDELWSQAGAGAQEESKERAGHHIISQMAGDDLLSERRQLRRQSRHVQSAASANPLQRQDSRSSEESNARPRSHSHSQRSVSPDLADVFSDFESTALPQPRASPHSAVPSSPLEASLSPPLPSLSARSLSPAAVPRNQTHRWSHVLDAKNTLRIDRHSTGALEKSSRFDPDAPIEALLAQASQSVTPRSRPTRQASVDTASTSTAQPPPSTISHTSSTTSQAAEDITALPQKGSPPSKSQGHAARAPSPPPRTSSTATITTPSAHSRRNTAAAAAQPDNSPQSMGSTDKENAPSRLRASNSSRRKSGVLIDPERMAAARARIAARKAQQGVLGVLR